MQIVVLPGDGIGLEVTAQAVKALRAAGEVTGVELAFTELPVGGRAVDEAGEPLPEAVLDECRRADAVFLGAVGGPRWDGLPAQRRPEAGLLALRQGLGLWANLRPVKMLAPLASVSPLREDIVRRGVDFLVVRELSAGLYYGTPRGRWPDGEGQRAVDTMRYNDREIERVVRLAFLLARQRGATSRGQPQLLSVDKANVLSTSVLWRETVNAVAREYPEVKVRHMYVDACATEMVLRPYELDVVVTENTFGDILSDLGGGLIGSLGLLPSASLGEHKPGLFEPVHGSAPDLAGQDRANPIGAILTAAMLLRHSRGDTRGERGAQLIERAVENVLGHGHRTPDLASPGCKIVGTATFGDLVVEAIRSQEE